METIIDYINNYIRENTIEAFLVTSFVFAIIYDIFKALLFKFLSWSYSGIKSSPKKIKQHSIKNIKFLIEHYEYELKSLEKIQNNDKNELITIIERIYRYLSFAIILLIFVFFINKIKNGILFYAFLGSSSTLIIRIFYNLIYDYRLIKKAKKYKEVKKILQDKIIKLRQLIDLEEKL